MRNGDGALVRLLTVSISQYSSIPYSRRLKSRRINDIISTLPSTFAIAVMILLLRRGPNNRITLIELSDV